MSGSSTQAGTGRWTARHDLTGGRLARTGHRGEAGGGERRGRHREGAGARHRWRPAGGHRYRPGWQCPRPASEPMSADACSRSASSRHGASAHPRHQDRWRSRAFEIDAPQQQRAGHLVPLVRHLPASHPGLGRSARPRADARRPLVGLMPRRGTPRGRGREAPEAEPKENQTCSSKLVRSTPPETAKMGPVEQMETR